MTFLKFDNDHLPGRQVARLLALAILPLLSSCGGGSDLACGSGTVQQGDQCVAKAAVGKKDGGSGGETVDSGSDTGTSDSSAGSGGGGAGGGGGGGADAAPLDEIQFGGI